MSRSKNGRTSWRNISSLTDVMTLRIIMTGGLKPEYYISKRILIFLNFWPISKFCKNDPYHVHTFLVLIFQYLLLIFWISMVHRLNCRNLKYEQKIIKTWRTNSVSTKFVHFLVVSDRKCIVTKYFKAYRFVLLDRFFSAIFW